MKGIWLTCSDCSRSVSFDLIGRCSCGGTMLVEYDPEKMKKHFTREILGGRPSSMWRYRELLPVRNPADIVSLGEGWTPLIRLDRWEKKLSIRELWVKREEQNPTGSFKARGFSVAVSLLKERNLRKAAVNSNGNAASALAAYAARAGMEAYVFMPVDCPGAIVEETLFYGAHTYLVDGLIHDAGKIIEDGKEARGWFHLGTAKEPGRVEGKKTMGLELAEQLDWRMPDVIVYPTGGGSGLIGIWKAFKELKELGFVTGDLPRFVSVQETGCAPVVEAVKSGVKSFRPLHAPTTSTPTGIRVPHPPAGNLICSILRETGGTAVAVTSGEIRAGQRWMGTQGIHASPEGAAAWAGLLKLCETGFIRYTDRVVLFNTAHAMKYSSRPTPQGVPTIRNYREYEALNPSIQRRQ